VFEAAPIPMTGVLQIRVVVTDANGQPDPTAALNGAQFSISGGSQSAAGTTNDAGHATIRGLPVGVELTVTQTSPPTGASLGATSTQPITLQPCVQGLLRFSNPRTGTGY
jgi:hypothetical protein